MKFLLDTRGDEINRKWHPEFVSGQLLTPLTRYADWGGFYAIDNGAFSGFPEKAFRSLLERQKHARDRCRFVTCPDIVGNGRRTLELWQYRHRWLSGWPAALVLQNGIEDMEIPWRDCAAVFIGGVDPWKESQACGSGPHCEDSGNLGACREGEHLWTLETICRSWCRLMRWQRCCTVRPHARCNHSG